MTRTHPTDSGNLIVDSFTVGSGGLTVNGNLSVTGTLDVDGSTTLVQTTASGKIIFDTGVAATAANYEIMRNNDSTNRIQLNIPTGAIGEFSVNDVFVCGWSVSGVLATQVVNPTSSNNSFLGLASTGLTISRNIADANICFIVDQVHASSTGDILEIRKASSPVLSVDVNGGIVFDVGAAAVAANYEMRRNADATNRMQYNIPPNALHEWSVNDVTAATLSSTNFTLTANLGFISDATYDIGTSTVGVNDIHFGLAGVINFDGGDVTITHAANLLTMAGGDLTLTDNVLTLNKASAGFALDINCTATTFTTAVGLIDIARTGALTGEDTKSIIDLNILPSFTLTEPASGNAFVYLANIDASNIAVTAGAGDVNMFALRLVAGADADANINVALWIDSGKTRLDGGGTSSQSSAQGGVLEIQPSTVTGNNASSTLAIGAAVSLGVTTLANGTASLTYTDVASVYIAGIPVASTNVIFTNTAMALWVDAGLTRLDGGVTFAGSGQSTLRNYLEGTFAPTVTLVGGAGNTTPVYTTNTGRYTQIGNQVFVDIYLTGDGGAEGAGTGAFTVAIPIASSASHPTSYFPCGFFANSTAEYPIWGQIAAGASVIDFAYEDVLNNFTVMTGAEQNNVTRTVRLKFNYEV